MGLAPLRPLLDRVDRVSNKAELTLLLGRGMRADVDPLGFGVYESAGVLGLSVEQSIHGEKTNVAFLVQGGLALPDREDYLGAEPAEEALRVRYRDYIARLLALTGSGDAESARSRSGARDGDRPEPCDPRGILERPQRRQPVDALRLREAGARDGLERLLRRGRVGRDTQSSSSGSRRPLRDWRRRSPRSRWRRGRTTCASMRSTISRTCSRAPSRNPPSRCVPRPSRRPGRSRRAPSARSPRRNPRCGTRWVGCTPSTISPPSRRRAWSESRTRCARRSRSGSRPRRGCRRPPGRARSSSCRRSTWESATPTSGRTTPP